MQSRGEEVLAESGKADTVDRPVQNHRRARAVQRHSMNQRVDVPVSARDRFYQPRAALSPATKPAHVGLQSGFIHKNEPLGIDLGLTRMPICPFYGDIGTILLGSPGRLFL